MLRRPPRSTLFPTRRSSDLQPLDLARPAVGLAAPLALLALLGGAGEHAVLGGDPPLPLPFQPLRDFVGDRGGAQDLRLPELDEHRPGSARRVVAGELDRTEIVRLATIDAGH